MKTDVNHQTFIKKYWVYIIILTLGLVLVGISIDVWYSNGNIQAVKTSIFDANGSIQTVNTYKYNYEHPFLKILSIFLYSFAMSILISLFILKVIQKDEDKQRELKDEIRKTELFKNVFKGVFDRLLPSEIFDVIKRDILEANVVRRNVKWTFDFKIENDELVLYKNITFHLHNLTSTKHIEKFYYVYSSSDYATSNVEFLKWHEKNDVDNTTVLYDSEKEEDPFSPSTVDSTFPKIEHNIDVPNGKTIVINFKTRDTYKNNNTFIHDTMFTTSCSSIGWDLLVLFPEGYTFSMLPMFTSELKPSTDEKCRKEYSYDGAILKGQGIEFTLLKQ